MEDQINFEELEKIVNEIKDKMTEVLPNDVSAISVTQAALMLAGEAFAQVNEDRDELDPQGLSILKEMLESFARNYHKIYKDEKEF